MSKETASIRLVNVSKTYGKQAVLSDISLDVREGELMTVVGPSGCGKTTLLAGGDPDGRHLYRWQTGEFVAAPPAQYGHDLPELRPLSQPHGI